MEKRFTAYKHLVEIKSFKEKVEIICEYELPFLEDDILLLRNLKDQAEEIEAYLTATDDAVLTSNVSVIDRSIFYRVLNLYKFDTFTQLKLLDGLRSLRRISERRTQTPPQSIPSLLESQPTPDPINNEERHNLYYNLTSFTDGSVDSVTYMMEHKQPKDGVRLLWKSDKGDAQLFRTILSWDIPSINKCIRFKSGKQLTHGDKLSKRGGNPFLRKILQGLK